MTSSEPTDKSGTPTVALVGGPITLSAIRRAEAQRIAAEREAAEAALTRQAPARPATGSPAGAPVIVKRRPPFTVALSQFFWIVSVLVGAGAVVYLFIIRNAHVDDMVTMVREVDATRADETYRSVADIISWSLFGVLVAILLVQVTALVSYAGRRPGTRWWMLGTLVVQIGVLFAARELVAFGTRGTPIAVLLALQIGFVLAGLLFSVLPPAMRWTARGHDVAPHRADEVIGRD
jgi:hypothetical protein